MSLGSKQLAFVGFMLLLAGLDFTGTLLAKEWTVHREPWQLAGGALTFLALFATLLCGLRYAEMSMLTLGWIVALQIALIIVDRSRYGTHLSIGGWLAVVAILVLQGYLLVGGGVSAAGDADERRSPAKASTSTGDDDHLGCEPDSSMTQSKAASAAS
jgi:hypothetical protein